MYSFLDTEYSTRKRVLDTRTQLGDEMYDIMDLIKLPTKEIEKLIKEWEEDCVVIVETQSFGHMSNKVAEDQKAIAQMIKDLIEFRNGEFKTLNYDSTKKLVDDANLANFKAIMARELVISKEFFAKDENAGPIKSSEPITQ